MKINAKCNKCGADNWKMAKNKPVCAVCRPRQRGYKSWPRHTAAHNHKGNGVIHINDRGCKPGTAFTIHRTPTGYRVVLVKPRNGGK